MSAFYRAGYWLERDHVARRAGYQQQLGDLLEITTRNLKKFFGVDSKANEYEVQTLDGTKVSETKH